MNEMHETIRELIALRLYGEIDAGERATLERHLAGCAECARYAGEIEGGLGAMPRGASARGADLPVGWEEQLREATREPARRGSAIPWWAAAAGFAAGVVATAVIARGPSTSPPAGEPPSRWERFHREEAPPRATSESQLARLSGYLRR